MGVILLTKIQALVLILSLVKQSYQAGEDGNRCLDGFLPFNGKCYFFGLLQKNWQGAKHVCEQMGAHLVSVESYWEDQFLMKEAIRLNKNYCCINGFYIGLNDLKQR